MFLKRDASALFLFPGGNMPYSGPDDEKLPNRIKQMPMAMRKRFVGAYNGAHEDCMADGGEDCEGMAMRVANGAIKDADMTAEQFLFFELQDSALTPGKAFAGFAAGSFVDMMGREVEFGKDALTDFLTNTLNAIKAAVAKGMPGLPIDARQHDKGDAAGWLVGAELGEVTDSKGTAVPVIKVLAEWTKLGVQLIKDKVQTNFSPTVDLKNKVIRGGSLTNWPASVDENGTPLFEAVELAQGVNFLKLSDKGGGATAPDNDEETVIMADKDDKKVPATPKKEPTAAPAETVELTHAQLDELVTGRVKAALTELEGQRKQEQTVELSKIAEAFNLNTQAGEAQQITHLDQLAELIEQQAQLRWEQKLANMQRSNRYAELAHRVTGGSPEAPRGIPVDADEVKDRLMKLPDDEAKFWAGVLETTVKHGLSDFSEIGHGKKVQGTAQLDPEIARLLKTHVANGGRVADFFEAAGPALGDMAQYNLSAFEEKEGGK